VVALQDGLLASADDTLRSDRVAQLVCPAFRIKARPKAGQLTGGPGVRGAVASPIRCGEPGGVGPRLVGRDPAAVHRVPAPSGTQRLPQVTVQLVAQRDAGPEAIQAAHQVPAIRHNGEQATPGPGRHDTGLQLAPLRRLRAIDAASQVARVAIPPMHGPNCHGQRRVLRGGATPVSPNRVAGAVRGRGRRQGREHNGPANGGQPLPRLWQGEEPGDQGHRGDGACQRRRVNPILPSRSPPKSRPGWAVPQPVQGAFALPAIRAEVAPLPPVRSAGLGHDIPNHH